MSNPYRLRSSNLFIRPDDEIREEPRRIVFLSVEGNVTEADYFKHVEMMKEEIGISSLVYVNVLPRANYDTRSDPESVLDLLNEIIGLIDKGIDPERLELPDGYDENFLRAYLRDPSSFPEKTIDEFCRKMQGKGINLAYLRFIADDCDKDRDYFCILIDRDAKSHDEANLHRIQDECISRGFRFFMTSPCFEFWLLLHLCDINDEYRMQLDKIGKNEPVSNKHSYVSNEVSIRAHHAKHISEKTFRKYYLPNIDSAIKQADEFETDISMLISGKNVIGTNLSELFRLMRPE